MDVLDGREGVCWALLASAIEMGEVVTEAGAISAAAAFFRQQLDACAWLEERCTPAPKAEGIPVIPPLLHLPLEAACTSNDAVDRNDSGTLAVSRGPGPEFSPLERAVCERAATLLGQAISRIRSQKTLAHTKDALEGSLRGMGEASDAVAVLVQERKERDGDRATRELEHARALSTAAEELASSRNEAAGLRRRLKGLDGSAVIVADAVKELSRVLASPCCEDDADGVSAGPMSSREETRECYRIVEAAAEKAFTRSIARVELPYDGTQEEIGGEAAAVDVGATGKWPQHAHKKVSAAITEEKMPPSRVACAPVPHGRAASSQVLHLRSHGAFSEGQESLASILAASLGMATAALRTKQHARHREAQRSVVDESERAAKNVAAAEAHRRSERAIAGMRALVKSTEASKARAQAEVARARRAGQQIKALEHLLAGLSTTAGDHAAVATVVSRRAAAAVPRCSTAALLTERCKKMDPGDAGKRAATVILFSPEPRAWASAARSKHGDRKLDEAGPSTRRHWARMIERAASEAANSGKTVFVREDTDDIEGRRVFCFAPVLPFPRHSDSDGQLLSNYLGSENVEPSRSRGSRIQSGEPQADAALWPRSSIMAFMIQLPRDKKEARTGGKSLPASATSGDIAIVDAEQVPLPEETSGALQGVWQAVALALACTNGNRAHRVGQAPTSSARNTLKDRSQPGAEVRSSRRDREEMEVLRRGTVELAARVESLEGKAAGLRASEARASTALAAARAEAMAASGELQVVALERDRLLDRVRVPANAEGHGSSSPLSARSIVYSEVDAKPHWRTQQFMRGSTLETNSRWGEFEPGVASWSYGLSRHALPGGKGESSGAGEQRERRPTRLPGQSAGATHGGDDASSDALQNMASVHKRLSESIRRGHFELLR